MWLPHEFRDDDWSCKCEYSMSMRLPCSHAIAFLKSTSAVWSVIPWTSFNERNVSGVQDCPGFFTISQTAHDFFRVDKSSKRIEVGSLVQLRALFGQRSKTPLTQSQRYAEALRVTQLNATELADIDNGADNNDAMPEKNSSEMSTPRKRGGRGIAKTWRGSVKRRRTVEETLSSVPKIRLNPMARKVGRPKKPKTHTVA
ncbi:hypothetical protein P3T76_013090 [Phytophthora citrophthora]|uniref:SWIM-type domain-containing protein n=1 Tax=Phytophthora citrophthora TaxID=4793 RepID=A0AAD9G3A3_9STRA|nr:hypothetical protein P3T76_013090 [Phytophthora citrophthora]